MHLEVIRLCIRVEHRSNSYNTVSMMRTHQVQPWIYHAVRLHIFSFIKNISPRKLIIIIVLMKHSFTQKMSLAIFEMSPCLTIDLSSKREDRLRLWGQKHWMTLVPLLLSWCFECSAAIRWQIATVSGWVLQKSRCSQWQDKMVQIDWKKRYIRVAILKIILCRIVFRSTKDKPCSRIMDTLQMLQVFLVDTVK